jgi:hypothetical protein
MCFYIIPINIVRRQSFQSPTVHPEILESEYDGEVTKHRLDTSTKSSEFGQHLQDCIVSVSFCIDFKIVLKVYLIYEPVTILRQIVMFVNWFYRCCALLIKINDWFRIIWISYWNTYESVADNLIHFDDFRRLRLQRHSLNGTASNLINFFQIHKNLSIMTK